MAEGLLLPLFAEVDLVQASPRLLAAARARLGRQGEAPWPAGHRPGRFLKSGPKRFKPKPGR